MSIVSGIRSGLRGTIRSGLNPGSVGDGPGGNILVPLAAADFVAATGRTPSHAWGCQESSGNMLDLIGSLNLVAAGTPLYSQSVSGWARLGLGFNQGVGQRFSVAGGSGWNVTTEAVAMLGYVTARTVTVAPRGILLVSDGGAAARSAALLTTGGLMRTQCAGTMNDGTIDHRDSLVHPLLISYDAASTVTRRWTDIEQDDGTFAAGVTDGTKGVGAVAGQNSWVGELLALWAFRGAEAVFTLAEGKALLQALGWSLAY